MGRAVHGRAGDLETKTLRLGHVVLVEAPVRVSEVDNGMPEQLLQRQLALFHLPGGPRWSLCRQRHMVDGVGADGEAHSGGGRYLARRHESAPSHTATDHEARGGEAVALQDRDGRREEVRVAIIKSHGEPAGWE